MTAAESQSSFTLSPFLMSSYVAIFCLNIVFVLEMSFVMLPQNQFQTTVVDLSPEVHTGKFNFFPPQTVPDLPAFFKKETRKL